MNRHLHRPSFGVRESLCYCASVSSDGLIIEWADGRTEFFPDSEDDGSEQAKTHRPKSGRVRAKQKGVSVLPVHDVVSGQETALGGRASRLFGGPTEAQRFSSGTAKSTGISGEVCASGQSL